MTGPVVMLALVGAVLVVHLAFEFVWARREARRREGIESLGRERLP